MSHIGRLGNGQVAVADSNGNMKGISGSEGQVLKVSGGTPGWSAPSAAASVGAYGSRPAVTTANKLFSVYANQLLLRLRVSGGNVYSEYSTGRGSWFSVSSPIGVTTPFTTAPDQYGLFVWPFSFGSNNPSSARIVVPHLAVY